MTLKVHISPTPAQVSDDNGVGKVVLAQYRYLQEHDIELTTPDRADVIAGHISGDGPPRVDVLHTHGLYWTGDPQSGHYARWHHDANRRILATARAARAISVPSAWCAEPFRRDMRVSPTVIGHGIEVDDWEPAEHKGYVLWNKNRAGDVCDPTPAAQLAAAGVQVVTTFAPSGITLPSLRVVGTQPHDKMKLLIEHAEAYLATTKETFGIGTLEALAAGVPILGYDWGGTADLVVHQETGYLVKSGDIEGLREGLEYIRAHRPRLAAAAREAARQHDWRTVMAQYAALYRRVADPEPVGVSVIITNHNYGAYLDECLASLAGQTDAPEIIVVDDGSTDNSRDILARWQARGGVRVLSQDNQGVAAARNAGIAAAQHAFVVCLDADDKLDPSYCTTLAAALQADRGLGIVYTGLALYDGERLSPNAWPPAFSWESQATPHVPPSNCIPSAAMFRKSMWERAGGYKQVYAPGEDAEFWVRGLSVGYTARKVTDDGLFHYRVGHQSASRTKEYRPIDVWHPWMRDAQYPMAAPARVQPLVRSYSEPAVSVIIPVGPGHAQYLPAALDSLLGQTCRDWEVIVVDDTQSDEIPEAMLATYPFVRYMATIMDHGVAYARNYGLDFARAPLVLFLDADDYLLPTALDAMLRAYVQSDGRYIYSDWLAVNGERQELRAVPDWTRDGWLHAGLHAVTALIPTAWARDVGGFDQELPGWEDWDFFIKLTIAGYCGQRVAEPLLAYRQHTGQRRAESFDRQAATKAILAARYDAYKTGAKPMPGCCGGNGDALLSAKRALGEAEQVQSLTAAGDLPDGMARMEFIGEQVGATTYFGTAGREYRGGNNPIERYANVAAGDVEKLISTGKWRLRIRPKLEPAPVPVATVLAPAVEPELVPAGMEDDVDPAIVEAANRAGQEHDKRRRGARA